jgi:hypothetical protein
LIVFGGTLAATMISFEGKEVFRALGAMREIIAPSSIEDKMSRSWNFSGSIHYAGCGLHFACRSVTELTAGYRF